MDSGRWEAVQALFHRAVLLPPAARPGFVRGECTGDPELAEEVVALLEEDARATSPLDRPLGEVAETVLDAPPAPPARRIGPYRLGALLGEGGMGVVYLAEREDLRSRVAIKMLRDAALSPARRERFAREQQLLARLAHPAIARLYDAGTLPEGTPYIVMEHVSGLPLTEHCRRRECPLAERLRLFRAVCEAVQFAHRHAIVHRDLKPSNVLVSDEGEVKLLDFGIAKELEDGNDAARATRTALRLMTPAYAAPEQIRGDPVGTYTDVYALGAMLYELLAGFPPFDLAGLGPVEAEARILEHDPDRPSAVARRRAAEGAGAPEARGIGRSAWAELDVLCLTALQKDPQRRYRTVEALVRDVDHFLRGEALEARPDSARYRAGKFLRRNWRTVAAAAALGAIVTALVGFYTVRLSAARDAARAESARTRRIQAFMLNLFNAGDEAAGPADTLRVVTLIDRGAREARTLDRDPAVQAELLYTLGGLYEKLGSFARADSLLQAALRQRLALGPRSADVARSLVALGLLRADQARFDEAEHYVSRGLAMARRVDAPDAPAVLRAQTALGNVLVQRGAYDRAIPVLEDAARREQRTDAPVADLSSTLKTLADADFYAGNYAACDSLNTVLLAIDRRRFGNRHPDVAAELIDLGAVQYEEGHYPAAESLDRQALAINFAFYGPDHPEIAADLTLVARAMVHQPAERPVAKVLLDRALRIRERVYGPDHPQVASTLNELGNLAEMGGDHAAAAAYFTRMLAIYHKAYGENHYLVGIALSNLAGTYMGAKRYARAEPLFREAIRIFSTTLSPDHLNTGIARVKLGHTLLGLHRYRDAERESLAGYRIVASHADPGVSWLRTARQDLVTEYSELGHPVRADRFRSEILRVGGPRSS